MPESRITVPVAQFAQKVKEKYPQYAAVPDDRLVQAFVQKFPQYKANFEGTVLVSVSFDRAPAPQPSVPAAKPVEQPVAASPAPKTLAEVAAEIAPVPKTPTSSVVPQIPQPPATTPAAPIVPSATPECMDTPTTQIASVPQPAKEELDQAAPVPASVPAPAAADSKASASSVVSNVVKTASPEVSPQAQKAETKVEGSESERESKSETVAESENEPAKEFGTAAVIPPSFFYHDQQMPGERSWGSRLMIVAAVLLLIAAAFGFSKTQYYRRYTQLPGMMQSVAGDLARYGEVKTEASIEGPDVLVAIRTGVDLIAEDAWKQQLNNVEGCAVSFNMLHRQNGIASTGTLKPESRSQADCKLNLRSVNPSGVQVVQVEYSSAVRYKTSGYPYWEVHLPSAGALQAASCNVSETAQTQPARSQAKRSELVLRVNDPIAAESIAENIRQAARLCGAADNRSDANLKSEAVGEKKAAMDGDALSKSLISQHPDFGACRMYSLEYQRSAQCRQSDETSDTFINPRMAAACAASSSNCYCNYSTSQQLDELTRLSAAEYITLSKMKWGSPRAWAAAWNPTDKLQKRIGADVTQSKLGSGEGTAGSYKLDLVLGCREISQIDTSAPTADGLKVDFSWKWKPTDFGRAAFSESPQHGIAYFKKTPNGIVIDRLEMREK